MIKNLKKKIQPRSNHKTSVNFAGYECYYCDKRSHIIYDGRCGDCEIEHRKQEAEKKFK